jgi:hypothetical protein
MPSGFRENWHFAATRVPHRSSSRTTTVIASVYRLVVWTPVLRDHPSTKLCPGRETPTCPTSAIMRPRVSEPEYLSGKPVLRPLARDIHRIQERAETTAVWSEGFCGAGLAAMLAWALVLRAGWNDTKIERLLSGCSPYEAIALIADCLPLLHDTRTLARLGLAELSRSRHKGLHELVNAACTDPSPPDSRDVARTGGTLRNHFTVFHDSALHKSFPEAPPSLCRAGKPS